MHREGYPEPSDYFKHPITQNAFVASFRYFYKFLLIAPKIEKHELVVSEQLPGARYQIPKVQVANSKKKSLSEIRSLKTYSSITSTYNEGVMVDN